MADTNLRKKINQNPVGARIPPHNLDAEQAALCCVLIDENAAVNTLSELKPEDFYSEAHALIFTHMQRVFNRNVPVDFVTLTDELESTAEMTEAGGISYITSLTNAVPSAANYAHYIDIVRRNAVHRRLVEAGQAIIEKAFLPVDDKNPEKEFSALEYAESTIYGIAQRRDSSSLTQISAPVNQSFAIMEELSKNPNAFRGIPTPFISLNNMLNGLCRGDLILIAARPGVGKTSLAMNLVEHAAVLGKKCAVFSLEMPGEQLARRMLCSMSKVSMEHTGNGRISAEEWKRLFAAKKKLADTKLYVDDSGSATPIEILSKCRRMKRDEGLDLIMIDYLQLMRSGRRKEENRNQEITEITRTLKLAAKELGVPILLLSQLSRDVEKRKGKPALSDLRESGSIEQDADIVMFIHTEYDENDSAKRKEDCELIIAKHRNGGTGTVYLKWLGEFTRFEEGPADYAAASLARAKKEGLYPGKTEEGESAPAAAGDAATAAEAQSEAAATATEDASDAPFEVPQQKKLAPMKNIAETSIEDAFED